MPQYIYLLRNKDIFQISQTKDLEKLKRLPSPNEIIKAREIKDEERNLLNQIHIRYSDVRLPMSEYFRLSQSQLDDCKFILEDLGKDKEVKAFFTGTKLIILFLASWIGISFLIIKVVVFPIFERIG